MTFQIRKLKRGETMFKSGTRLNHISIVESGTLNEILHVTAPQCIGEECLFGSTAAPGNIVALEDSSVIEVPAETVRNDLKKADMKLVTILKALAERLRTSSTELRDLRAKNDNQPCPPSHVPMTFGLIYHAALRSGTKTATGYDITMKDLEDYAVTLMGEAPYRIQCGLKILQNLGYVKNDSGKLSFTNMVNIETFIDYYRSYYFKTNGAQVLRTNEKIRNITLALLKVSETAQADRSGAVRVPYKATMDALKEILGKSFEADQLFSIEQKGLLIKKITSEDGGWLAFFRAEYEQMIHNWTFLKQIEEWNEKGYVE